MKRIYILLAWSASVGLAFWAGSVVLPTVREVVVTREAPAAGAAVDSNRDHARAAAAVLEKSREDAATAAAPVLVLQGTASGVAAAEDRAELRAASVADARGVIGLKDSVARAQAFARLRDGMNAGNARGILELFLAKGFSTTREEEEIRMLAEQWASVDGRAAADFLVSLDSSKRPENTIRSTLSQWAAKDLDAAEQWARAATTNQPNYYMIGVISGASQVDVARAERLLYEMPYGRARGEAMQYVAGAHLERGLAGAMNWAASVPDPRLEQAAIRRVAAQVALDNPRMAADWVVQHSNEEQAQYNVGEIAKQWSQINAEDAANWAFGLQDGPVRDAAVAATLPRLAESQPAVVERLLLNSPPSRATDGARMQITRVYSQTDPVRALAWANTLSDRRTREETTRRVVESWSRRDPAAAAAFLQPK